MIKIKHTVANTRTRTLLIIIALMLLIGVSVAIYSFSSKSGKNKANVSPTSGIPTNMQITPGAKSSEKYIALQQAANMAGTKKADAQGKTFIPTIIGNKSDDTGKDFNSQLNDILKEKGTGNSADTDRLSKQLASLLAMLNAQGDEINNLLRLLKELQNRGYNVADLEALIRKLMGEGYNTDELAKLLAKLKDQGYKISDLEDMLRRLLKEGYDPDLIKKLLDQLLKDKLKALEDAIRQLQEAGYNTKNIQILEQQVNNPDLTKLLEQLANQGYKMNSLEDLLKQLMDKGYNISDWNITVQQLQKDGYDVNKLQDLLNQLKAQGMDIKSLKDLLDALAKKNQSLESLLKRLQDQGADLEKLKKLLADLQNQGFDKAALEKLIADLIRKGLNPDEIYAELLRRLHEKGQHNAHTTKEPLNKEQLTNIFNSKNNPTPSTHNTTKLEVPEIDKEYSALLKKQHEAAVTEENNKKQTEDLMVKDKQLALNTEAQQKAMEEILKNMNTESDLAAKAWNTIPSQSFVQGDLATTKDSSEDSSKQNKAGNSTTTTLGTTPTTNNDNIIKAGSILFAVLETAVNSDEPGPILARIVQPPLNNSKLIGKVEPSTSQYSETLVLTFTNINIPERIRSYAVAAVAIDPDTARTALASDVDHHYLLRWGTVFAATFLQGYSSAVAQSGTTVNTTNNGAQATTTTQQAPLNPKQQIFQGLGSMATGWGQGVSQFTNRPATITINSGVSLGILFTSDFTIPSSDEVTVDPMKQSSLSSPQAKQQPVAAASQTQQPATSTATTTPTVTPNQTRGSFNPIQVSPVQMNPNTQNSNNSTSTNNRQ